MKEFKLLFVLALIGSLTIISCSDDNIAVEEDQNVTESSLELRDDKERTPCYTLNYPVTLIFPDASEVEVNSRQEAREARRSYYQNGGERGRVQFSFPIGITLADGSELEISDQEALQELNQDCRQNRRQERRDSACFQITYPITVSHPTLGDVEVNSHRELVQLRVEYRRENRDSEERISINYPITVTLKGGDEVTVDSAEAFQALRKDCRQNRRDRRRDRRADRDEG